MVTLAMLGPLSNMVAWGNCHELIPFWTRFAWFGACDWPGKVLLFGRTQPLAKSQATERRVPP
jgi:hypothetical protein